MEGWITATFASTAGNRAVVWDELPGIKDSELVESQLSELLSNGELVEVGCCSGAFSFFTTGLGATTRRGGWRASRVVANSKLAVSTVLKKMQRGCVHKQDKEGMFSKHRNDFSDVKRKLTF